MVDFTSKKSVQTTRITVVNARELEENWCQGSRSIKSTSTENVLGIDWEICDDALTSNIKLDERPLE